MSTRYPHKWLPGYTAEDGQVTGMRTSPSGKLLHVCQRCGQESPAPSKDEYEGTCFGAWIQGQAQTRAAGRIRITDVTARVMHRLALYTPASYQGTVNLLLSYAAENPDGWADRALQALRLLHPKDYIPLRAELEAITAMTGRPWQEFDHRSLEAGAIESGVTQ